MFFDQEGQAVPENDPNQVLPVLPVSQAPLILGTGQVPASGLALGPGNGQAQDQKRESENQRSHVEIVAIGGSELNLDLDAGLGYRRSVMKAKTLDQGT